MLWTFFASTEKINLNFAPWGAYMFLKHFLFIVYLVDSLKIVLKNLLNIKAIHKNIIGGYAGQYFLGYFFYQYHRFILEIIGKNSGKITVVLFSSLFMSSERAAVCLNFPCMVIEMRCLYLNNREMTTKQKQNDSTRHVLPLV